jgi:hypothetical protein
MAKASEATIREAFAEQAEACAERGSPFTGRLCEALARVLDRSTQVGQRVLDGFITLLMVAGMRAVSANLRQLRPQPPARRRMPRLGRAGACERW